MEMEKQILSIVLDIQSNQITMLNRLDRIEERQERMEKEQQEMKKEQQEMKKKQQGMETEIKSINKRLDNIEKDQKEMKLEQNVLVQKVDYLLEQRRIDSINIAKILEVQTKQFHEMNNY